MTKQSKFTSDLPVHDRNMFQCTSRSKKARILPTREKANVTIDLNGKTTSCDGMQPARLKCTTAHLVHHLGGVAASIDTLSRAGAHHWRVRVPVLCNCGVHMSLISRWQTNNHHDLA